MKSEEQAFSNRRTARFRLLIIGAAVVLSVGLLAAGCVERMARKAVQNCEFNMIGLGIEPLDQAKMTRLAQAVVLSLMTGSTQVQGDETLDVSLVMSITNKNSFSITIDSLDYNLFLDDKQVATGGFASDRKIALTSGKTVQAVLPANISLLQLLLVLGGFQNLDDADYRVEGTIVLDSAVGKWTFPVNLQGKDLNLKQGLHRAAGN
ncbi:MAG: LEA type 2 family protein [Pseudomonadota bacterium]